MKEFRASIITWNPSEDQTYLPGSVIKETAKGVSFKNELMSPGKTIVKWFSQVNYQATKIVPKLPLLEVGKRYRLTLEATVPAKKAYLKLVFLNRFGEIITTEFIKECVGTFIVPAGTYEYQIELINAGVKEFVFERLILTHAKDEFIANYLFELNDPDQKAMAVFFAEPSLHGLFKPKMLKNSLLISSLNGYHAFAQVPELQKRLTELNEQVDKLVFVGSGPISALVATYYGVVFEREVLVPNTAEVALEKLVELTGTSEKISALKEKLKTAKSYHQNVKSADDFAAKLYEKNANYDFLRVK